MSYILTARQTVQSHGLNLKFTPPGAKDGEIEPVRKILSLGPRHLSVPNSAVLKSNGFDVHNQTLRIGRLWALYTLWVKKNMQL